MMTIRRLALVLLVAGLVAACPVTRSTDREPAEDDAAVFKIKMDAFVRDTLPKLQASIGGEWGGYKAQFFEKGGNTGLWEYTAGGGTSRPPGTGDEVLDKAEAVLREQGMDITRPGVTSDIAATKDGILVSVSRMYESDIESVTALRVEFISEDRLSSSDDFADNAGYTELLK